MITFEHTQALGFDHAIRGMRNAMESWDKSDSYWWAAADDLPHIYFVGENDLSRMKKLSMAGSDHRKYLRMIVVYADIVAPRYWWEQFSTYRIGVVMNSCSTMHKIHSKEIKVSDFSTENLMEGALFHLKRTIEFLNIAREKFVETKDKKLWWQMIQMLPQSYNQRRTVMISYEALANIYKARKDHKLDEWRMFCRWIEELPYSEIITGKGEEE